MSGSVNDDSTSAQGLKQLKDSSNGQVVSPETAPPREHESYEDREDYLRELRLFLESLCCDVCRFRHVVEDRIAPDEVRIRQEVSLGIPGAFADISVTIPHQAPYFVEVKYGYTKDAIVAAMSRKFGASTAESPRASRVLLLVGSDVLREWTDFRPELEAVIHPGLELEVWDENRLFESVHKYFNVKPTSLGENDMSLLRSAIDRVKGAQAFGSEFTEDPLQVSLLWNFSFWDLRRLHESGRSSREMMPPGSYKGVVSLFADLSCFSSYVRDTRDEKVVRQVLTAFYAKTRHQITDFGGMLYQFLGDGVMALFGLPMQRGGYIESALECGRAMLEIGDSVATQWQRRIDHVEKSAGCHVGIAIGDLNMMSLRPFSRLYMGAIADSLNMASRLADAATAGEIVVSNTFYQRLTAVDQRAFARMDPIEAHNMGALRAWKLTRRSA